MSRAEKYDRFHVNELKNELKQKAWMLEAMPPGLIATEQRFFTTVRNISFLIRSQRLSQEQGKKEVKEAERAFEQDIYAEELYRLNVKLWGRIETAATNYARYRNQQNADAFYAAVYGFSDENCFKSVSTDWEGAEKERWVSEHSEEQISLQDTVDAEAGGERDKETDP